VSTTVLPASPITSDLSPARIADLIDAAATLIEADGLEVGSYWAEALLRPYEPGMACCTAGALASVSGYRDVLDVEAGFVGLGHYDAETNTYAEVPAHPVFAAAMAELGFTAVEDLYNWSDAAGDVEVVEALRDAAAKIRAQAGGA
jgi:hypothetical protein